MMKLVPLHEKILVRPRRKKEVTKSGIILPETNEDYDRPNEGWVVATNQGKPDKKDPTVIVPCKFKEGELVFFTKHVGMTFKIEDEKFLMLNEDQIIGKISVDKLTAEEQDEFRNGTEHTGNSSESGSGKGIGAEADASGGNS